MISVKTEFLYKARRRGWWNCQCTVFKLYTWYCTTWICNKTTCYIVCSFSACCKIVSRCCRYAIRCLNYYKASSKYSSNWAIRTVTTAVTSQKSSLERYQLTIKAKVACLKPVQCAGAGGRRPASAGTICKNGWPRNLRNFPPCLHDKEGIRFFSSLTIVLLCI